MSCLGSVRHDESQAPDNQYIQHPTDDNHPFPPQRVGGNLRRIRLAGGHVLENDKNSVVFENQRVLAQMDFIPVAQQASLDLGGAHVGAVQ